MAIEEVGSSDVRPADRIKRAFDAAFQRMCAAATVEDIEDEMSNLQAHLYRLGQYVKKGMDERAYYALLQSSDELRTARAAMWARGLDVHGLYDFAVFGGRVSDFVTQMYGVLEWKPLALLPSLNASHGEDRDYAMLLAGRPLLDTLCCAFDALMDESGT